MGYESPFPIQIRLRVKGVQLQNKKCKNWKLNWIDINFGDWAFSDWDERDGTEQEDERGGTE